MRKTKKTKRLRLFAALTSLLLALMCGTAPVFAETDTTVSETDVSTQTEWTDPTEPEELGSITITLTDGKAGTSKAGVVFTYAQVADWQDGLFVMRNGYESVDLNQVTTANELDEAAKTLAAKMRAEGTVKTDKDGKAALTDLQPGVYLLNVPDRGNYDLVSPALIAIPTFDEVEGVMQYDIEVIPKHTPPPDIPKTGDEQHPENWIILAVISAAGAALFLCMLFGGKQKQKKKEQ